MTFEYNASPKQIKIENAQNFVCGDRKDGYNGLCKEGSYCTNLNVCAKIPYNTKTPITQHLPISYERNYGYRVCRNDTDNHCIRTECKESCDNTKMRVQ